MNIKFSSVFVVLLGLGMFVTAFATPVVSYAQSCGGPACSDTQICCRRDTAARPDGPAPEGPDKDYFFMLCVADMPACTNMGGYNAYPGAAAVDEEKAGLGEDCTSRACEANLLCDSDIEPPTCVALPADEPAEEPAQDNVQRRARDGGGLINVSRANSIDQLIVIILNGMVYIGMILLVLALVYVGFLFIIAQGVAEKITEARTALFWTVIGGLLLLGASALSLVVQEAIGVL